MNGNPRKRNLWLSSILVLVAILCLYIFGRPAQNKNAEINIEVAPSAAKVKIDGHSAKNGINKVVSGEHIITASYEGFADQSKKILAIESQQVYAGFVLLSNNSSTSTWYDDHPKDKEKSGAITSRQFDSISKQSADSSPLLSSLPYVDLTFRIDYGTPLKSADKSKPALFIKGLEPKYRQLALDWIREQGADPSDYEINFVDAASPLEGIGD
jgi:hypothetical protein